MRVLLGELKPVMTFLHNGKRMSPSPPQPPDRSALRKGVVFSGNKSVIELNSLLKQSGQLNPQELGDGAVRIMKSLGMSVNITI